MCRASAYRGRLLGVANDPRVLTGTMRCNTVCACQLLAGDVRLHVTVTAAEPFVEAEASQELHSTMLNKLVTHNASGSGVRRRSGVLQVDGTHKSIEVLVSQNFAA